MFLKSRFDHFRHTDFFTLKILLPEKPIKTPHEFDLPCEKYKLLSNLFFHLILLSFVECASCKTKIALGNILFLKT